MIFYYGMTNFHILSILLHKLVFRKNDKAVLYVSIFLQNNQPKLVENLRKSGLFEKVVIFQEHNWSRDKLIGKKKKEELNKIIDLVEKQLGDNLKDYNEINISADHDTLGIYLLNKKIEYNYFEDGCSILSNNQLLLNTIKNQNYNKYLFLKQIPIIGNGQNVINRYGNLKKQKKNYKNEKDIHFSVEELLQQLSTKDINKILRIFDVKKFEIKEKSKNLLLTWHYYNMNYMTLEDQKLFFSLLVDYFSDNDEKLVIKPHPSDTQGKYEEWFKDAIVLNRYMPSELLPCCFEGKFRKGITNWSTSVYSLSSILDEVVDFDTRIDTTFKSMDTYYTVVKILEDNKTKKKQKLTLYNINDLLLKRLLNYYFKNYEQFYKINIIETCNYDDDGIYIVSDKKNVDYNDKKVINIDSFASHLNADNILEIDGINKEYIGIYNFKISKSKYSKQLKYSNYNLNTNFVDKNKYVKNILKNSEKLVQINSEMKIEDIIEERKYNSLDDYNRFLSNNNNKLYDDNQRLSNDNQKLLKENKELSKNYSNTLNELYTVLNSKSWKLTNPIRKITVLLKGKK